MKREKMIEKIIFNIYAEREEITHASIAKVVKMCAPFFFGFWWRLFCVVTFWGFCVVTVLGFCVATFLDA
jgi:hypothetical protein